MPTKRLNEQVLSQGQDGRAIDGATHDEVPARTESTTPVRTRRVRLIERLQSNPVLANQYRRNYIRAKLAKHF